MKAASPHRGDRSRPRGQLRGGDQRGKGHSALSLYKEPRSGAVCGPPGELLAPRALFVPCPAANGVAQAAAGRTVLTRRHETTEMMILSRQHSRGCDQGRPPHDDDRPSWPCPRDPSPGEPSAYDWEGARSPGGRERSVRRANLTLPDADHRAPEIRHQASAEAPAARKAAELRATLTEIRAELGRMAAYVAENPRSTAIAAAVPAARLEIRPAVPRTTKPAARPAEPVSLPAEPAIQSATPAEKPPGRPRQFRAMRLAVLVMTIPILFGLIAATTELALHGYGYFVFRSAGTGATQQGPSEPPPSQPSAAHHRRHAGPSHDGPPCASLLGSETARAIRTN